MVKLILWKIKGESNSRKKIYTYKLIKVLLRNAKDMRKNTIDN